jgi:hypothetical protein
MANPARGEVALVVGNLEYTLKFSTNAICELEDRLDKGLNTIIANMERLSTVRALLWAGLRAHHPEVTILGVGEIVDSVGAARVTEALGKALTAAFPAEKADAPKA